jgi:hypothetical protein
MNIGSNGKLLLSLTKDLLRRWERTKLDWRDAKAVEFERKYIHELTSSTGRAGEYFEKLDKIIEKVRRDCE